MQHLSRHVLRVTAIGACLIGTSAFANEVSTSFEFTDVDGEFTLGSSPTTATFLNGLAQSVGIPGLYTTGFNAWMIEPDETGTITFETPGESIDLFFKDQLSSNNSVLTVFDINGNIIDTFNGSTSFQNVNVTIGPKSPEIGSIEFTNNGASGWSVIDDFTYCASKSGPGPIEDPILEPIPTGDVHVKLTTIAEGMTAPNWGIFAPDDPNNRLFVTDQDGILWVINLDTNEKSVFLDVSDRLVELGVAGPGTFDERGLLGLAFHPDYQNNGLLYTYESHPFEGIEPDFSTMPADVDPDHQTVIAEWQVPEPADPASTPDPDSAREILRIDQPQFNHDAGAMNFGPDGLLYIALGDGGAGDDQGVGHAPLPDGNGQTFTNILGSVIRIDPLGSDSANGAYGIPADNPFVGKKGVDEIYAYGLRNPFRFSFDMMTGELWLADAGQNDIEEVDLVNKGDNLGWPIKEGTFLFDPNGDQNGFVFENSPGSPPGMTDPVAQYDHDEGVVVVGGFVNRGVKVQPLQGRYVFAEFAQTFSNDGRLFYLDADNSIFEFQFVDQDEVGLSILGFGQDANGEVYVLANSTGTPFENTGVVLRIEAKTGDFNADGMTGVSDLLALLGAWGPCENCTEDIDMNGTVGVDDLLMLLANWG